MGILRPVLEPGSRAGATPVPARVDPERWITRTIVFLLSVEVLILILDVIFNFIAVIDDQDVQEIFNVAREMSINNWFSSMQEAGVGLVLWLIYLKVKANPGPVGPTRGWAALAIFFFYIGLDDGVTIHERVSTAIENPMPSPPTTEAAGGGRVVRLAASRFPSYAWQVSSGPASL
jgi:hypothetical protein